jgi:hypothetical protein
VTCEFCKAGKHWNCADPFCDCRKRQERLERILALRNSIEAEKGTLSESYPLIREDRER